MNATCEFAGQLGSSRLAVSTSIVFVVGDDISVRELFGVVDPQWSLASRRPPPLHKNSSTIHSPVPAASFLLDVSLLSSRTQWPRTAKAHRYGPDWHADHFYHRPHEVRFSATS